MSKPFRAGRRRAVTAAVSAAVSVSILVSSASAVSAAGARIPTETDSAVTWCMESGIAAGYADGGFHADTPVSAKAFAAMCARAFGGDESAYAVSGPVTRYEAARVLSDAAGRMGADVDTYDRTAAAKSISDYGSVPEKYRDAVCAVYSLGIMTGGSDGRFNGAGDVTRGQAAVLVYRTAMLSDDVPLVAPRLADGRAITEDNVFARLAELKFAYSSNRDFKGYVSIESGAVQARNSIKRIVESYVVTGSDDDLCSTDTGCGGWAAFVCDYIFGQDALFRKTTLDKIRPGDLMLKLDSAGKLAHVQVCTGRVRGSGPSGSVRITNANNGLGVPTAAGTTAYKINWTNVVTAGSKWDVYTAYPE